MELTSILSWPLAFSLVALGAALRCYYQVRSESAEDSRINTKAQSLSRLTQSVEGVVSVERERP